jgi:hypothetical protein
VYVWWGAEYIYNTRVLVENEEVRWVVNSETISNVAIAVEDRKHLIQYLTISIYLIIQITLEGIMAVSFHSSISGNTQTL